MLASTFVLSRVVSDRKNERTWETWPTGAEEGTEETRRQKEAWRTSCTRVLVAVVLRLLFGRFGNGEWIIGAEIKRMKGAGTNNGPLPTLERRQLVHRVDEPRFISRPSARYPPDSRLCSTFVSRDLQNFSFPFFFYLESEMKCLLENKNLTKLQTRSCYLTVLSFDHDVILLQLFYKQRHYDRSRFLVSI